MAFDYFEFDEQLKKIEEKIGYLKGNELAWQYLVDAREQLGGFEPPGPIEDYHFLNFWLKDCVFPVPGHPVNPDRFFEFKFWVLRDTMFDLSPAQRAKFAGECEQYMKDVAEGAVKAWHNGASWASGLASYCRQVCDSFTRPDAQRIAGDVGLLHSTVISKFSVNVLDDWAKLGGIEGDWDSRAGRNFQTFYANYDGQIAQMAYFSVQVAQAFAAAAYTIHGTQQGVIEFAKSIVRILDQQLEAWAPCGPPPRDAPEDPPWVADVTRIVQSGWKVLGHVPVIKDVKSQIDAVITAGQDVKDFVVTIADVSGVDLPTISKKLSGADSDDIYQLLTSTLYDDYQQKYAAAMDSLQSGTPIDPASPNNAAPIDTGGTRAELPPLGWFPTTEMPLPKSVL